ncbi:MAG: bifunctional riboflavin kinase/FAD synthetase [Candidatus Omnitrophota bacterium]|jgi:riboflavin kinase/FMN adenylyltransferase|nr:MAG: bifunctional riboflavin kinase/FAD synthetase [Candidatus Omnitrophota bacterium]
MKIIRGLGRLKLYKNTVVALGVFDGLHLGHRKIIAEAVKKARHINGTSVVLTFWPDPHYQDTLSSFDHKLKLIGSLGVEVCIVLSFNSKISSLSPSEFISRIIIDRLNASYLYVGRNFKFGKNASGDFNTLIGLAKKMGINVVGLKVIKAGGKIISSTYIRRLIRKGLLSQAEKLLLRPVSVHGKVIKGRAIGRNIGFPTANISPEHEIIPPPGIYAVRVFYGGKEFDGVCYIGKKQSILKRQSAKDFVEVHIFGINKDLYNKSLEIEFIKKIREDRKFRNILSLREQIVKDIKTTKAILSRHKKYHKI